MSGSNDTPVDEFPYGYCQCGCGQKTNIAIRTDRRHGDIKGRAHRYVHGHQNRITHPIEHFWSRVDKSGGDDACWLWTGRCDDAGYGQGNWEGRRSWRTHRIAYTLTNDTIPDGLDVLHKCDNPPCCNPAHLFLGTDLDNAQDKKNKGRCSSLAGEQNPSAKLTIERVIAIRERFARGGITRTQLAKDNNVHGSTIGRIVSGAQWNAI